METVPLRSGVPANTTLTQNTQPDLLTIALTPITEHIPDSIIEKALQTPPFVPIPGASNLRDIGLLPNAKVKSGLLYRSGSLHVLPESSIPLLKSKLKLSKIFDLRYVSERIRAPNPETNGVEQIWVSGSEAMPRDAPAEFMGDGGMKGFIKMYDNILRIYASSYRTVLEYLRDEPNNPIIFHCSGKFTRLLFLVLFR
jgi:hypothetical protein